MPNPRNLDQKMQVIDRSTLEALLSDYGFDRWAARLEGRRLRCPHGLLIGLTEECPVGCVSPLVVLGLADPDTPVSPDG